MKNIAILLVLACCAKWACVGSTLASEMASQSFWSATELLHKKDSYLKTQLQTSSYMGLAQEQVGQSFRSEWTLGGTWDFQKRGRIFGAFQWTLGAWREWYLYVRDAFVKLPFFGKKVQVSLGRKKQTWSSLDEDWALGILEPEFQVDRFQPKSMGLTGLFLEVPGERISFQSWFSPLWFPNQGAAFELQNGRFSSSNPFFYAPDQIRLFRGVSTPIIYHLNKPSLGSFFAKPAGVLQLRVHSKKASRGASGSIGYGYLPMTQLAMNDRAVFNLKELVLTIEPKVLYHQVVFSEVKWEQETTGLALSGAWDIPQKQALPSQGNVQNFDSAQLLSASFFWKPWSFLRLKTGMLQIWGGKTEEKGQIDLGGGALFEPRFSFRQAVAFGAESTFGVSGTRKMRVGGKWIYDFQKQGSFLSAKVQYSGKEGMGVFMGADLLGVEKLSQNGKDFLNTFRAHDRVYGGLEYVF